MNRPRLIQRTGATLLTLLAAGCAPSDDPDTFPVPEIDWNPRRYVCYTAGEMPTIDGRLNEASWESAPWTSEFVDIRGPGWPEPRQRTRARMLWDTTHFYVGVVLEETDVWGTLTERDSVIYHDNDFELFVDPDGDTHDYYELEINALGTEWDLMLRKPYRDAESPAVDSWNIEGLQTAVAIDGTLNQPGDTDRSWTVEIAIPWNTVEGPPGNGDQWRINFSRVEWRTEIVDDAYGKLDEPEDNWVWSPQGLVAMHYPEMWGLVQFSTTASGGAEEPFAPHDDEAARWALRQVYYAQKQWFEEHAEWAGDLSLLDLEAIVPPPGYSWPPEFRAARKDFLASTTGQDGTVLRIRQDGRVW